MEKYVLKDSGAGMVNAIVDTPIALLLGLLLNVFCAEILKIDVGFDAPNPTAYFLFLVAYISYYVGFETCFGRTIGKFITVTIVVDAEGNIPSFGQILLRTLCRFIPFEPISSIFSFRAWHYRLSQTYLIDKNEYLKLSEMNSLESKIEQIGKE